jgi:hypothetical protein
MPLSNGEWRLRYGRYMEDRYHDSFRGYWRYWSPMEASLPIVFKNHLRIDEHELCWPLFGKDAQEYNLRLDKYDIKFMLKRYPWKQITKEHYRMIVRRVLGVEVHDQV